MDTDSQTVLRIVKSSACLVVIVLSLFIFSSSMSKKAVNDEHATCAAGVLLTKGKMIYRDFACVAQMPYHPLLCAAVYRVLNTTYYLFSARLLTVLCDILIVISIIGIFRHIFSAFPISGFLLGMAMATICVFNGHFSRVSGFAINKDFMIFCVLVSFWLFICTDFKRGSHYLRIGIISVLLTMACCMDFTAVFILLLFFIILAVLRTGSVKARLKTIFVFLISPVIVLILPVLIMLQSPHAFFINVFELPLLRMRLIHKMNLMRGETFFGQFVQILTYATEPQGIFPFLVAICLIVLIISGRRGLKIANPMNALLAVLVPVIFFLTALCTPIFLYEHFAKLVPFIIISFAYPLLYLRNLELGNPHKLFRIASIVAAACTFSQAATQPLLERTAIVFRPQSWVPIKMHQISEEMAQRIKEPKLVVTLAPLYALESGCDIYLELSSGWDGCKIASVLPASKREITKTLNPKTFRTMIEQRPPSGVVIDIDAKKDEVSSIGLVLLRIAKTRWPDPEYDENVWERIEHESLGVVSYHRL
jgi:hypothetical protein